MTALNAQPVAIADDAVPAEARGRRKRPRHVKGTRPGWFVYACLGVVLLASVYARDPGRRSGLTAGETYTDWPIVLERRGSGWHVVSSGY